MSVEFPVDKPILAEYLAYLFPSQEDGKGLAVTTTRPLGALLLANVDTAPAPVPTEGANIVLLDLPRHGAATSHLDGKWLHYTKGRAQLLNMALQATFDLDFEGYYRRGERLGFSKKEIVEAFIFSRKLNPDCFDAIHKREYRRQIRTQQETQEWLVRRAYYIDEKIDKTGLQR